MTGIASGFQRILRLDLLNLSSRLASNSFHRSGTISPKGGKSCLTPLFLWPQAH